MAVTQDIMIPAVLVLYKCGSTVAGWMLLNLRAYGSYIDQSDYRKNVMETVYRISSK